MLHEFIAANRDEVLRRSAAGLAEQAPERSTVELLDHLPSFLDEVIAALRADAADPAPAPRDAAGAGAGWPTLPERSFIAVEFADQRHNLGLSIEVLARGFGLLSDAITGIAAEQGVEISAHEFQLLNRCLDTGIATSISAYLERSLDDHERRTAERIGSVAHELRNGLASATMAFSVLRGGQVGIASRTGDVLERSLERLRSVVEFMLTDSQLRAGVELDLHHIELSRLLHELAVGTYPERGVTVQVEVLEGITIQADLRLLTSAITNLLHNAVKFSHDQAVVTMRGVETPAGVTIEVEDECGGLPEGDPAELLEPFVRRSTDRRGAGLGLSITRDSVQAHGGALTIQNRPGKGCIFALHLPRAGRPPRS